MTTAFDTETNGQETASGHPRQRHILLATDGSRAAEKAGRFAARLTCGIDARFTVAAVAVEHGDLVTPWDMEPVEHSVPLKEAKAWAHSLGERLRADGIDATEIVLRGHAADALAAEAESSNVDFLVIGQQGRSDAPPYAAGSVAQTLARTSPCPLLIVP